MALDFLTLADRNLSKQFNAKAQKDQMPARRNKVMDGIKKALASIAARDASPKRGAYSTRDGITKATLRLGNRALTIDGESEFYVPWERVGDFYTKAGAALEHGELDAAIQALQSGDDRTAKAPTAGKRGDAGRPMDPVTAYGRNIKKYGQERADVLLDQKQDAPEAKRIRDAYKKSA